MEVKVVISLKGEKGSIGVQSPNCDPIFITFEGDLNQALEKVPELVAQAEKKWDECPRYPKTKQELTQQPAPSPTPQPQSQRQQRPSQQRMF